MSNSLKRALAHTPRKHLCLNRILESMRETLRIAIYDCIKEDIDEHFNGSSLMLSCLNLRHVINTSFDSEDVKAEIDDLIDEATFEVLVEYKVEPEDEDYEMISDYVHSDLRAHADKHIKLLKQLMLS